MKSIIIAGAPRSGKTTLTRRIQTATNLTTIYSDALVDSFKAHFPELGIIHGQREKTSANLLPFLTTHLKAYDEWQKWPFLLDITYLFPQQVIDLGFDKKYTIVFMGCPNISREEKLQDIRLYPNQPNDWTTNFSDEYILECVDDIIAFSKLLETECKKHNLTFIDTSKDFENVLDRTFNLLMIQE